MNKKIVVIVVIVECVLAILMVSLLGAAIENAHKAVKCTEIYFVDKDGNKLGNDAVIYVELKSTQRGYQLEYVIEPDNTADKTVQFESSEPDKVSVTSTGYVDFYEDVQVTITVTAMDGSSRWASITLKPKSKAGKLDF
jgi:hypothetical protein